VSRNIARIAGLALLLSGNPTPADEEMELEVYELLLDAREEAGAGEIERRPALDAVARARAEHVAGLPHSKRLTIRQPIGELLDQHDVGLYRRSALHLDMQRGYMDPAAAFHENWTKYRQSWQKAIDPAYDAVGVATAKGDDGWLILAVVLLQDEILPEDTFELERNVVDAINEIRRDHGLGRLAPMDGLADIARDHSADMVAREFFAHRSPDGRMARQRVEDGGVQVNGVAENLYKCRGVDDPLVATVEGWMESKGHRKNILGVEYTHTGVGIAVGADGTIYFTQLFTRPPM
jgi:uncharacterized protein YkwD